MTVSPGHNGAALIDPIDFDADYDSTMDWYGVPDACRAPLLDCAGPIVLDGTLASALRPFRKTTADLGRFKSWIGMPDRHVRSGKAIGPQPGALGPYDPRLADAAADIQEHEHRDLLLAAGCYLFGDSDLVAEYRAAIEARMAPFEIAVYAARRVVIRATGSLTLEGPPAVLITSRIDLQHGGALCSKTVSRILSDQLVKSARCPL